MKLHAPAFERALRRRVRETVRRSPELRREARAAKKSAKRYDSMLLLRPAVGVGLWWLVWQMMKETGHPASGLALISLWGLAFVFIQAQRLVSGLYASADLPLLTLLPIDQGTVFRWELQKCIRGSLWFLLDLLGAYGAVAAYHSLPTAMWLGVVSISVLTWGQVLAIAALFAAYLPRLPYPLAAVVLTVGAVVLLWTWKLVGHAVIAMMDQSAAALNLALPTGWPAALFQVLLPNGHPLMLGLTLPIAATILTLKQTLPRLRAGCVLTESVLPEASDMVSGDDPDGSLSSEADEAESSRVGVTGIEEMIRSRQFLAPPRWHERGWLEGWLWRWLDARERVLAEFVFPDGLSISAPWRTIFRNFLILAVITLAAGWGGKTIQYWALFGGALVVGNPVLWRVLTVGRAFEKISCSGVNLPRYAGYPVGFCEMGRFLFKCSLVQLPVMMLFMVSASVLVFLVAGWPWALGVVTGIKAGGLLLMSRYVVLTFAFSSGTNDCSGFRLRTLALLVVGIAGCVAFVGLGAASLFPQTESVGWLLWGTAGLAAYGLFRFYGWFYHSNRFDLMRLPQD